MSKTLLHLVSSGILPDDRTFLELLHEVCLVPETFTVVSSPLHRKIYFATPSIAVLTGYSAEHFIEGGYEFLFSITAPESIPQLLEKIRISFDHSKTTRFDPHTVTLYEFVSDLIRPDKTCLALMNLAIVIGYTSMGNPETIITMVFEKKLKVNSLCKFYLERLKELHNQLSKHPTFTIEKEPLQKVFVLKPESMNLTIREKEVLKLLAGGLTSIEIAEKLSVTENTVETHRKSLLSKFQAKNVAELIKKASKLYWLE